MANGILKNKIGSWLKDSKFTVSRQPSTPTEEKTPLKDKANSFLGGLELPTLKTENSITPTTLSPLLLLLGGALLIFFTTKKK